MKTSKIRQSAKGEDCLVRAPGICNGNPETVVLAHINGGGIGRKNPDWQGAYACSACHEWLEVDTTTTVPLAGTVTCFTWRR